MRAICADGDLGHLAEQALPVTGNVPDPAKMEEHKRAAAERALDYMGLQAQA